jgi:integrase
MEDVMKRPRHVSMKNANYYYVAKPAMKTAGLRSEALGRNPDKAFAQADYLNAEWDKIRELEIQEPHTGQFGELINQFQRDPYWYGRLAPVTKEDIDRAYRIIVAEFQDAPVAMIEAKHVRNFINRQRVDGSIHRARKIHKWLHRLFRYSIEIGVRDYNSAANMRFEQAPNRTATWSQQQIEILIGEALSGGLAASGNAIPPRSSIALVTMIAYDTAQRQGDILSLQWPQYFMRLWCDSAIRINVTHISE